MSIELILGLFNKNMLYLPRYQRGKVWSKAKSSLLIDSFLRPTPIPIQGFLWSEDKDQTRYKLLDGGNRTISLKLFADCQIPSYCDDEKRSDDKDNYVWFDEPSDAVKAEYTDKKHRVMTPFERVKFLSKMSVTVTTYTNLTIEDEILIFARQQYGEPPTKGEILRITTSNPLVKYLNSLIDEPKNEIYHTYDSFVDMYKDSIEKSDRGFCYVVFYSVAKLIMEPTRYINLNKQPMLEDKFHVDDFSAILPADILNKTLKRYLVTAKDEHQFILGTKRTAALISQPLAVALVYICSVDKYFDHVNFKRVLTRAVKKIENPSQMNPRTIVESVSRYLDGHLVVRQAGDQAGDKKVNQAKNERRKKRSAPENLIEL